MKKKDAYYFSHDANAQDDHKCMHLISELGMEGYGIFWALIEKLRSEKSYELPLDTIPLFASRWGTTSEKIEKVVNNFKLFKINKNIFYSERLKKSMTLRSDAAKRSLSARWTNSEVLRPYAKRNTNVIQNDTIKGKEKEREKKKGIFPPAGGRELYL